MEVLGEMLRAPNVPQGHRKRKANHKTRFPFTYLDRFLWALFSLLFLVVFLGWFRNDFWSGLGSFWDPFFTIFPLFFPLKK